MGKNSISAFIIFVTLSVTIFTDVKAQQNNLPAAYKVAREAKDQSVIKVENENTYRNFPYLVARISKEKSQKWGAIISPKYENSDAKKSNDESMKGNQVIIAIGAAEATKADGTKETITFLNPGYDNIINWVEDRGLNGDEKALKITQFHKYFEDIATEHFNKNGYTGFTLEWIYLPHLVFNDDDALTEVLAIRQH